MASLSDQTVYERGLVDWPSPEALEPATAASSSSEEQDFRRVPLRAASVLSNHKTFCRDVSKRQFSGGDTLAYVTPWNRRGYEMTKVFARKLGYVSPVWFQIAVAARPPAKGQPKGKFVVVVKGQHEVNRRWMADVKRTSPSTRIVPRFVIEGSAEHYARLLASPKLQAKLTRRLTAVLNEFGLDGAVLEWVDAWPHATRANLRTQLNHFMVSLAGPCPVCI